MNIRTQLLVAAAAIVLPAGLAAAQTSPPADPAPPVGGNIETGVQPTAPAPETATPPVEAEETPDAAEQPTEPMTQPPADAAQTPTEQAAGALANDTADAVEAEAQSEAQAQTAPPATAPVAAQTPPPATAPTAAPTQPAATATATPATPAPAQPAGQVTAATAADVTTGATVRDQQGGVVGTIESVDAQGAILSTGTARARVPISSFGRDAQGLVFAMTKAQFEAAVQAQSQSPGT